MFAQERLIKTINHEEPDRIPSFEGSIENISILEHYNKDYRSGKIAELSKLLYYICLGSSKLMTRLMKKLASGKKGAEIAVRPVLELYRTIGYDMVPACPLANLPHKFDKKGFINEFGRKMEYKKNPVDDMTFSYYVGGLFENFEDYEKFPKPDPDDPIRENLFKAAKQMEKENKGKIYVAPEIVGIMEITWEGFGFENFSKLLVNQKKIKQVFDDRGNFAVEMMKRIVDWGEETGPVIIYDDYGYKGGLFMSPRNYRAYILPWLKEICRVAHKGGLKVLLHSCGDIYKIFPDIIDAGVDAINPIEPTTSNPEYDIFKLNEKFGDKITFVGNVSPQDLADKKPQFIEEYTKRLIKELGPGGGFILASGHSINPAVKKENFFAMRETYQKYCKYPINIK